MAASDPPIFEEIRRVMQAVKDGHLAHDAESHLAGWFDHHDQSQAPAPTPVNLETAQPEGEPVSVVADLQNFAHELAAKAAELEQTVLPAAAGTLTALEGNPVVDSLLNAVHVPPEALAIVVKTIDGLEELYKPAQPVTAAPAQ